VRAGAGLCTVHKRWLAALLLVVVAGCSQQGRYVPIQDKNGDPLMFDTHTGKVSPVDRRRQVLPSFKD
jgi:hypothetical protein